MSNVDKALSDIKRQAKSGLDEVYTRLRRDIRRDPGAAPASERFAMNAFFSALSADARLLIIGALDRDGIEHPGLKWANSIAPQLQDPRFDYLQVADVYARIPNRNDEEPGSHRTSSKLSSQFMGKGLVAAAGSLGVGAVSKLAGSALNVPVLSGVGTVCLLTAVVTGGLVLYSAYRSNNELQSPYEKSGNFSSVPVKNVSFDDMIDNQMRNNQNALDIWISDLGRLARNLDR